MTRANRKRAKARVASVRRVRASDVSSGYRTMPDDYWIENSIGNVVASLNGSVTVV
jgi:hypothetical protein